MNDEVEPKSGLEAIVGKQPIHDFARKYWMHVLAVVLVGGMGAYSNTYVRDRAKDEITLAGGVSQGTYNLLKGEVDTLKATVKSLQEVNAQQDLRLNASIDRLDSVIDTMLSERSRIP